MLSFCLFCFFGDSNTQRSKARNRKSVRVDGWTKKLFSGLSKKRDKFAENFCKWEMKKTMIERNMLAKDN